MVYNTGLYGNYNYNNDYFYNQYLKNHGINTNNQVTGLIQPQTQNTNTTSNDKYEADDGKISFGKKVKNFVKGIGKFFTGMFTDENGKFSLKKTLKTAALAVGIGAVCVLTAGTAVPALIAAGGVVASGVGVVKGAVRAANATTDAEAEAAWQSIGSSTTALGLSVVGARAVAKGAHAAEAAAGRYDGARGLVNGVKDVFVDSGKAIGNFGNGIRTAWTSAAGESITGRLSAVKNNVVEQGRAFDAKVKVNYKNSVSNIKTKIAEKENSALEKKQQSYQDKANNAKTDKMKKYYQNEADKIQRKIDARNEINNAASVKNGKEIIDQKMNRMSELKTKSQNGSLTSAEKVEMNNLAKEIEIQRNILNRKTAETNIIESKIAAKQKQLDALDPTNPKNTAKINELKTEINDLDKNITFETSKTSARRQLPKLQEDIELAQNKYNNALLESQKANSQAINDYYNSNGIETSESFGEAVKYADALRKAELELEAAKTSYNTALNTPNSSVSPISQAAREILIDAKNNPSANWLTMEYAGRKEWYPTYNPIELVQAQTNPTVEQYPWMTQYPPINY